VPRPGLLPSLGECFLAVGIAAPLARVVLARPRVCVSVVEDRQVE
jgi:hypothetical protein